MTRRNASQSMHGVAACCTRALSCGDLAIVGGRVVVVSPVRLPHIPSHSPPPLFYVALGGGIFRLPLRFHFYGEFLRCGDCGKKVRLGRSHYGLLFRDFRFTVCCNPEILPLDWLLPLPPPLEQVRCWFMCSVLFVRGLSRLCFSVVFYFIYFILSV